MTDVWWHDEETSPAGDSEAPARELVPEGEHEFQVKQTIDTDERLEVRLAHGDQRYGWVFCNLQKDHPMAKRLGKQLAAALGVAPEEWNDFVRSGDMAGRRVRARVYQKPGSRGGTFVNVGKFLPAGPAAPVIERAVAPAAGRAPVSRPAETRKTRTQAADAASGASGDDIPF